MNKEEILSNLPPGYVYIAPGEYMPETSYYIFTYKEITVDKLKDINNWHKYARNSIGEKRNKDLMSIFIKVAPAPVVPPAPKYQYKEITDITPGDLFLDTEHKSGCLVIQCRWEANKYSLSGRNGLHNYANCQEVTREVMISYLNDHKKIFICNINDKIKKTIEAASKMV
jgi:hypothetical protein